MRARELFVFERTSVARERTGDVYGQTAQSGRRAIAERLSQLTVGGTYVTAWKFVVDLARLTADLSECGILAVGERILSNRDSVGHEVRAEHGAGGQRYANDGLIKQNVIAVDAVILQISLIGRHHTFTLLTYLL